MAKKSNSSWAVLFIPTIFFIRRLALAFTLIFWIEFIWGQMACQFAFSVALIIFIQWKKPFESQFDNNMETFSEVITIFVLYMMICFTDFILDPMMRFYCGKFFISVICSYALVHIIFLLKDLCLQIRSLIRAKYYAHLRLKKQAEVSRQIPYKVQSDSKAKVKVQLAEEKTEVKVKANVEDQEAQQA